MANVELQVIEVGGVEVTVLDAPGAQVAIGSSLSNDAPQPIGTTAAAGTSGSAARIDHIHAHGNQTGTSLHALATTSGAGFMSSAQFDLLAGATNQDTADSLVRRDGSGDFEANVITADLAGNAATATVLATARTINGQSFDGSTNITITAAPTAGSVVNATVDVNAAIALSKLATGALPSAITVASANLVDGTIVNADVNASAAIAHSKLAAITAGHVLIGGAGNVPTATELAGDLTVANNGIVTLSNSGVSAGTHTKVTVDAKGRVTTGENLAATDVPTITSAKVSDFDAQVQLNRLDQLAAPTANVSLNTYKITNLADPVDPADAATKAYVDAAQQGLSVKDAVRVATTASITLSGTQTIDGVAVVAGNRVLVKNQSTGSQNGLYVVAAGAWSRSTDADVSGEVTTGLFVFVEEGTVNANSGWVLQTTGTITLDTTSLSFAKFSGAGQVEGGTGLTKVGNALNVNTASSDRIVVNADDIDLATAGTAGTYRSVTTDAYGRVTAGTNPTTLSGYGITDAATSTHVHGNITNDGKIGSTANLPIITTASGVLAAGSFGTAANTFCQGNDARLSDQRVPTDGSVTNTKVASDAAIAYSKLASITAGQVLLGNSSNVATATALSGDVTVSSSGVTAIGSGVIVDADVSSTAAIALSKLATGALPTAITVASANLVDGTIANVDVSASAAIAGSKIAPDFGAQNILTTGTITGASINPTGTTVPAVGLFRPATNVLAWATNTLERMRVDSLGRLLVNTTASTNFSGTSFPASLQARGTSDQFALGLQRATSDASGATAAFRKTRSTTDGDVTIVQDNDVIGSIRFAGTDGVGAIECARIESRINGTPGVNDMPGRLVFLTTGTGGSTATERVRIDSSGNVLIGNTTGTERLSVTGKVQLTATGDSYMVGTNNVVGSRKTGWAAATGTATRTTFATSTVTTADLAQRVKALIDDLISHGLIGT